MSAELSARQLRALRLLARRERVSTDGGRHASLPSSTARALARRGLAECVERLTLHLGVAATYYEITEEGRAELAAEDDRDRAAWLGIADELTCFHEQPAECEAARCLSLDDLDTERAQAFASARFLPWPPPDIDTARELLR